MTLRRWSFEKAARQRVRAEVRASESLRKEWRLARAAARRRWGIRPWMYRLGFLGFLMTSAVFARLVTVEYVVALILLWTLATTFFRASQFRSALYDDPRLIVFDYWPISDAAIFRAQWNRFLRGTWWTLLDFALGYFILLAHSGDSWHALAGGVVLGAVQWVFIVAMAVCLVAFARPKYIAFPGILFLAASFVFLLGGGGHPGVSAWLSNFAWCVPPAGWIVQSLGVSNSSGLLHQVVPVVLSAAVLALAPIAFQRVRQGFLLSEPRPATDGRTPELIEFGQRQAQSANDVRAAIARRQFLAGLDWQNAGFLERLFSRHLNARERTVAEFLLAGNPGWSAWLKGALPYSLVALVVLWLFGRSLMPTPGTLVVMVGAMAAVSMLASPRGFHLPREGGLQSPYYAVYPIGFGELTRVLLKVNLTKTFVLLFCLLAVFMSFGGFQSLSVWDGLRWVALALVAQPLLVIATISPNTNDTHTSGLAWLIIALMLVLMGAGATFYFAARWWVVAPAGILAAAISIFGLLLYGRAFNRSRFDLVPLKRPNQE
ncbi:MAG: hypothetical protein ABSG04_14675 [Verrucomicrobiota bacterium]